MTELGDDALLSQLGDALRGVPATRNDLDVATLRHQVVAARLAPIAGRGIRARPRRSAVAVAAAVAAASVALGGGAVAAAAGASLPTALRGPIHSLGIPVDSPALSSTRDAMAEVRRALADANANVLQEDVAELRRRLDHLSAADRRQVEPAGGALLAEGDRRLEADGVAPGGSTKVGLAGPLSPATTGGIPTTRTTAGHGGLGPSPATSGEGKDGGGQGDGQGSSTPHQASPPVATVPAHDDGDAVSGDVSSDDGGGGQVGVAGPRATVPATSATTSSSHGDGPSGDHGGATTASTGGHSDGNLSSGQKG